MTGNAAVLRVHVANHGTLPITSVVLARVRLIDRKVDGWERGDDLHVETVIPPQGSAMLRNGNLEPQPFDPNNPPADWDW